MNKEFSNIIIFNNETIEFVLEKIKKIILDLGNSIADEKNYKYRVDIIHDNANNICVIASNYFEFTDSDVNKSVIRKISKRLAQDAFFACSKKDYAVIEKYSFNKRIYDYIAFGNEDILNGLGYNILNTYMYQEVWKNHFVGRNTMNAVDKILFDRNTYFNNYEILVDILKLYGIKYELTTYNFDSNISSSDIQKITLYFK